jgi:hypothetical protein
MLIAKQTTLLKKQATCILLVFIADVLFYQQPVGWTAGLYAALVFAMLVVFNRHLFHASTGKIIGLSVAALIVELVESPGLLPILMGGLGLMTLITLQKRKDLASATLWIKDIALFVERGGWQWYRDCKAIKRISKNKALDKVNYSFAVMPVTLTLAFSILFILANPIIEKALSGLNWQLLNPFISYSRWLFWFLISLTLWMLLRPRFLLAKEIVLGQPINLDRWLNKQTIILSLALFNGLFFIQNGLDIVFLWHDEVLPMDVTYAEYAHAGFYPLLAINLLTAAFVLLTFGDHRQAFQTEMARKLVFVWLGQNIFLTLSAINRLLHYIEAYSLTYLRIAALMGMTLTAIALLLIIARIQGNRRNHWLINANAIAVVVTLYGSCYVNMDRIIADYNVRHCLEVTGLGSNIDLPYLQSLGAESLPALRWFQVNAKYSPVQASKAGELITNLDNQLSVESANWRAWTWRKQRQLATNALTLKPEPIGTSGWRY